MPSNRTKRKVIGKQPGEVEAQGFAKWVFICDHSGCQTLIVSATEQEAIAIQEKHRKEHEYLSSLKK